MASDIIINSNYKIAASNFSKVDEIAKSITNQFVTKTFNSDNSILNIKVQTETIQSLSEILKTVGPKIEEISKYLELTDVVCVGDIPDTLKNTFKAFDASFLSHIEYQKMSSK